MTEPDRPALDDLGEDDPDEMAGDAVEAEHDLDPDTFDEED